MKKYLKTNIIGFVIAGIIVSGFAVYAAVTFPSSDVTYDNGTSGLESNNVQGAIDELYTECTKESSIGDQILESAGLEKDPYECRYFFTGANPNNYITFNGESAGWRIISAECDGTIKIIKIANIGDQQWDTSNSNDWTRPATLNTYLNQTYYNSLNATAQSQIVAHDFSIGKPIYENDDFASQIAEENSSKWNGKVALSTVSEYIRTNSNQSSCGTFKLNNNNYTTCPNTNWMFNGDSWWLLSTQSGLDFLAFNVDMTGQVYGVNSVSDELLGIYPVVYISPEVQITGGDGTESNPYTIE